MRQTQVASALARMRSAARPAIPAIAMVAALLVSVPMASATITAPGSATALPGGSTRVTVGTDGAVIQVVGGGGGGASIAPGSGSAPSATFTLTVGSSVAPGSQFTFSFADDVGGFGSVVLTVAAPPTTTTTSSTTTTTQPPPTTTTRPTTTTTRPTTTTTRPTTTTSSSTTTTSTTSTTTTSTTLPPTTTTLPPTTTTLPPTTTTSSLVPAGITALGDDGGGRFGGPFVWFGGGAALLAALLAGAFVIWSRQGPTYGAATPGAVLVWRQRRERRKIDRTSHMSRSAGLGAWWRTAGPMVAYHEWRTHRHATKTVRRQIEERQRLRNQDD